MRDAIFFISILFLQTISGDAFSPVVAPPSNVFLRTKAEPALVSYTPLKQRRELNRSPLSAITEETREADGETIIEPTRIVVECQEKERLEDRGGKPSQSLNDDGSEYSSDVDSVDDDDQREEDQETERRRRAAIAARLLKKGSASSSRSRSGSVSQSKAKQASSRSTSVGARREGSASRARGRGGGLSGSILKGVRTSAAAAAAAAKRNQDALNEKNDDASNSTNAKASSGSKTNFSLKKNIIQSTIDALIETQNEVCAVEKPSIGLLGAKNTNSASSLRSAKPEMIGSQHLTLPTKPIMGTILVNRRIKGPSSSISQKQRIRDCTSIRVATERDDLEIAKLRLSVFSDFSPEVRRQFRTRSCEVLNNRRMKGATCLVACVNYSDINIEREEDERVNTWVVGSLECSTHEFAGTQLGARRPGGSIIYITEVAVSPRARRTGAGKKLLKGVVELAKIRGIETIYLHVDVDNEAACALYQQSGYEIVDPLNPIYNEFTTRLNLHDGATKGRNHYLLEKKISETQTWFEAELEVEEKAKRNSMGVLGFEIPDLV